MKDRTTVIGVFDDHSQAQKAVNELKRAGFGEEQIGITARDQSKQTPSGADGDKRETYAQEGGVAGLATGAGIGTLWGLGILAGVLPAIGPAIAGGTLAAILSSAAAGAAAAGLAGALVGLGIPEEEAKFYDQEFRSGRVIVTVGADGRQSEAMSILQRFGGYDMRSQGGRDTSARRTGAAGTRGAGAASGQRTLQAREEELRVRKTPVQTGEVDVHKEVRTEHRTLDVPVSKEELVIERHQVSGRPAAGGPIGEDEHVRVPLSEEQVSIEKEPVVREEVTVGKRTTQQQVEATARKEQIKTDERGPSDARQR